MKVVINKCYGGYGLSHKACLRYAELAGFTLYPFVEARDARGEIDFTHHVPYTGGHAFLIHYSKEPLTAEGEYIEDSYWSDADIRRNDPLLVQVISELGEDANGPHAELHIVEIPDDVQFEIDEYDGIESIHEVHRAWY